TAQVAVPTDLILTRKPPLAWTNETRIRSKPCASLTRALSHQKHWSWRPVPHQRAPGIAAGQDIPAAKKGSSRAPLARRCRGIKGLVRTAKQMRMQRRLAWSGTDEGGR